MPHYSITKWIEPYVLLETLKANYNMEDFTFDGFSKKSVKDEFYKKLQNENTFGLYMKNVNKYYLFSGSQPLELDKIFGFTSEDYVLSNDWNEPLDKVDSGKAEAGIIIF